MISMAVISLGNFDSFFEQPSTGVLGTGESAEPWEFSRSEKARGLAVKQLTLNEGFQSFLTRLLRKTSDFYFLSWAWDLSGSPPFLYPGDKAPASLLQLRDNQTREFIGEGALLFPARPVTAGLAFRMQLWESKQNTRDFGETMKTVSDAVINSELTQLIAGLAAVTSVPGATVTLIAEAAAELGGLIGKILAKQGDEYADFFEGYFSATADWPPGEGRYRGQASEIVLTRMTDG